MGILLLIIGILAIVIIAFFIDRKKSNDNIEARGGMLVIHSELITLLSGLLSNSKVVNSGSGAVFISGEFGSWDFYFNVIQMQETITIRWDGVSILGKYKSEWTFPEYRPPHEIVREICEHISIALP